MLHWQQYQEELNQTPSFDDFMQFLLYQVVDPQTYKEQVTMKYYVA